MKWSIITLFISSALASQSSNEFATANNQFASTAYKEILKSTKGNFLFSPFSTETVVAFAQSGCKDQTAQELRRALHLPDDKNKIENAIKAVLPQIQSNERYALHTANKMYVQNNYPIHEEFKRTATEVYNAESENIDFTQRVEAAKTMNQWVEKHTNNKIQNLIDPNNLNNRSRVLLLNGLYFKGDWQSPFQLADTQKRKFYRSANDVVEVDIMYQYAVPAFDNFFLYYECSHLNAKFLELPFNGTDASMTFILPNEKEGLAALESQIDRAFTPHNLTLQFVNVAIPKFKIESKIDLKEVLENLGVRSAFYEDLADLTGISGKKGDLIIDKIVQKSFIDVSEEGVEAAAATYVLIGVPLSGFIEPPKEFYADHPFIFYIKIKGVIVFAGRVTDPKQT